MTGHVQCRGPRCRRLKTRDGKVEATGMNYARGGERKRVRRGLIFRGLSRKPGILNNGQLWNESILIWQ